MEAWKKGAVIWVLLFLVVFQGCLGNEREITEEEKSLLVTIDDFKIIELTFHETELCESYKAKNNIDGSLELEYEYDFALNEQCAPDIWVKSEVEIVKNNDEVATSFNDRIKAYKIGAGIVGGKIMEDTSLFQFGDESFSSYIVKDKKKIGNIVVTRKGDKIFSILISGLYFDDPELLDELLLPKLNILNECGKLGCGLK